MQLRTMDEFFAIQRCIGEVAGVVSLQNEAEPTEWTVSADMIEEAVVEEVKQPVAPVEGEGEAAAEEAPADGDEEQKQAPKWKPEDYKWTKTEGKDKNLP